MLWDHLGRRFINLSYLEADAFSRTSKEFITSLFPKDEIYASLLPPEARRLIGRVAPAAVPAMRMLERQGFSHCDEVDPFDGGPYIEADRDEIPLVRATCRANVDEMGGVEPDSGEAFVSTTGDVPFKAARCSLDRPDDKAVRLPAEVAELLGVGAGDVVGVTPVVEHDEP